MAGDGAFILFDVRGLTLSIICEPCSRRDTYSVCGAPHGTARRQPDRSAACAGQLPECPPGQPPRSVWGSIRKAFLIATQCPIEGRARGAFATGRRRDNIPFSDFAARVRLAVAVVQPPFMRKGSCFANWACGASKSGDRRDERRHVAPKGAFPAWPWGGIGLHTAGGAGSLRGPSTGGRRARRCAR